MKEKQAVTREYAKRYAKADRKEKSKPPGDFTALTGYNRKYAVRVLRGAMAKPKAGRARRPANRKGKRYYTDDVIERLRLIWAFFHWKRGKLLAPLTRQNMAYIAAWKPFNITPEIREKLMRISPSRINYYLRQDKAALKIKGKSLTKPANGLKSRIPIRAFYTSAERKTPGFIQIDTVHHRGPVPANTPVGVSSSGQAVCSPAKTAASDHSAFSSGKNMSGGCRNAGM
jgi:Ni/Co efflux regulator RcnB